MLQVGRSPNIVIVFDCSTETMIQRLLIRSQMGGRVDDHERIIRHRLETHYTLCEPVLSHYLQKRLLRNVGLWECGWAPSLATLPESRQGKLAYFVAKLKLASILDL